MQSLKVISFTHKNTPLKELNRFFLHEENRKERLAFLKFSVDIDELLYLATCNRIEFIFSSPTACDKVSCGGSFSTSDPTGAMKSSSLPCGMDRCTKVNTLFGIFTA